MTLARDRAKQAVEEIGLDISSQRNRLTGGTPPFTHVFSFSPNAIQQAASEAPLDEKLVIIESETGSGKTEAALGRFALMYEKGLVDGLYFALPTRAAATQLHGRVTGFVERLFPEVVRPNTVLAVPGYQRSEDYTERHLQNYLPWWETSSHDRDRPWAAESSKRYLAAQIAVGTVDQAMMAALKVKHAHMRAACLARNLLIVDEVHASDTYMRRIIKALLNVHLGAGGHALLMSATLGSSARQEWLSVRRLNSQDLMQLDDAIKSPYPAVSTNSSVRGNVIVVNGNNQGKSVHIHAEPVMHDFAQVAQRVLQEAQAGAKVLVIRNTVDYAIGTQQAMEKASSNAGIHLLFSCRDVRTLHHGRFAADDRRLLDSEVETRLGKDRNSGGLIVVGTQTLEQSLDIDADLLITDLCPADVLLQRIGRLHRHRRGHRPTGYEAPTCIVLTPQSEDLSPLLKRGSNRNGLGPHGHVYADLRILEATRRLIGRLSQWNIPSMNRELVELATHPEALKDIVQELGDEWRVHAHQIEGGEIAEGITAANSIIRRDKSFFIDNRDVLFPSGGEENIRTRLGDEGIEVEFDPPPPSPFDPGRQIERMVVPEHLLRGASYGGSISPDTFDGGFTFAVGDRALRYDRLGLRRLS